MRGVVVVALLAGAVAAYANDLTIDRRTIRLDESLTIIVSLENQFANVDGVNVPVRNLTIDSAPSVSSEYSWINGSVVRRKVFRFTAHPIQAGAALVGPLVVIGENGERETLAPLSLQVVPDEAAGTNDPLTILRELLATNREPFFVVAEAEKTSAYVGEEIVVTWYLYNAASVQRWQITRVPKLADFWSEEIDVHGEQPSQTIVGTMPMERVPLRRVALFPLHGGTLTIGGMEVSAEILRRNEDSPFGLFEGSLMETRFPSASFTVDVLPLPSGAGADVVGDVMLDCTTPIQRAGGPVTFAARLNGRANLRSAAAPRFDRAVAGDVEVQPLAVSVRSARDGVTMTRSWNIIIFPAANGTMTIPALAAHVFNPRMQQRQELRCAGTTLEVQQSHGGQAPSPVRTGEGPVLHWTLLPWVAGIALAFVIIVFVQNPIRRELAIRREVRRILRSGNIREAVDALVDPAKIANEASERGDAYRALRSLLDALDRDRALEGEPDLERRVRDLVQSLR